MKGYSYPLTLSPLLPLWDTGTSDCHSRYYPFSRLLSHNTNEVWSAILRALAEHLVVILTLIGLHILGFLVRSIALYWYKGRTRTQIPFDAATIGDKTLEQLISDRPHPLFHVSHGAQHHLR